MTCGSSGYQAAHAYSLIRPPRGIRRASAASLWVPENSVTSCDLRIFMDQAFEPVAA